MKSKFYQCIEYIWLVECEKKNMLILLCFNELSFDDSAILMMPLSMIPKHRVHQMVLANANVVMHHLQMQPVQKIKSQNHLQPQMRAPYWEMLLTRFVNIIFLLTGEIVYFIEYQNITDQLMFCSIDGAEKIENLEILKLKLEHSIKLLDSLK